MADNFHVSFKMFVDRPAVTRAVDRWTLKVLSRTGAYGRTVMRRKIRPQLTGKKRRTVMVEGRKYLVPARGMVIDVETGNRATTRQSEAARRQYAMENKRRTAGSPPRRGPSDLLRRFILFGVDRAAEEVVIGPMKFNNQPSLVGVVSVPELLEKGGSQVLGHELVKYDPHPFAAPSRDETLRKMEDLIERVPLR